MDLDQLVSRDDSVFFRTYKRLGIAIERGEGCYLYTTSGEKILDMFGGLAVNVLGYGHKRMNDAIKAQVDKYIHISNFFYQPKQIELAEKIKKLSGFSKVFFSNSGTESIEAAIKLVRKFFLGTDKTTLVSFTGSFHGRTMGALSLTARKKYREQFQPLLPDVLHLEFNSAAELETKINERTAAVFIECLQGEGGINPATPEFIAKLNELKKKFGFIIAADEIQSGVGRTGTFNAFTQFGLDADIFIMAKGIGGGLPLGAIAGSDRVADVFTYGEHGSTFGGNPVAAASGVVVMEELENGLISNNKAGGELLRRELNTIKQKYPQKIKEVRGMGLMAGIELSFPGDGVVTQLMKRKILVNCTNDNVIRLLPPFIISSDEIKLFCSAFEEVMSEMR
ncbi:MAG TPA: acetylornithine/succinylornithine family transaminase [Ignavibacteria bacterium]|nr:acetylornithine/succinylornithine family transaminase [Ignavibacteria bacterium]HRF66516.1 acetylornithine/succinylornithine family transaminase [Ignavibacteria bacterium]HRJ03594.1 acetylornithine/succinylornithine family transaminase [Ignavibacteria bacterium]